MHDGTICLYMPEVVVNIPLYWIFLCLFSINMFSLIYHLRFLAYFCKIACHYGKRKRPVLLIGQ